MPALDATRNAPVLYFDLASPYAYLAAIRAERVLGVQPQLQPVLLGAMFAHRGFGSWAHTPQRESNMREIERRASAYGLPLSWPEGWPANSLVAQRAAVFAAQRGVVRRFVETVYLATFGQGGLLEDWQTLLDAGERVGLASGELEAAVGDSVIKAALREATDRAIELGVTGVPTLQTAGGLHFGDDQLEAGALEIADICRSQTSIGVQTDR